jgi:protein-disulfide isomerase
LKTKEEKEIIRQILEIIDKNEKSTPTFIINGELYNGGWDEHLMRKVYQWE